MSASCSIRSCSWLAGGTEKDCWCWNENDGRLRRLADVNVRDTGDTGADIGES